MEIGNRPAHPSRRVRRPVDYLTQAVPLIPDDQTRLLSIIRTETSTRKDLDFGLRPFGCNRTAQLLGALGIVDMIDIRHTASISVRPHYIEDFLNRLLIATRRGNHLDGSLLTCRSKHTNGKATCECANQLGHAPILDKIVEAPQRELHLAVRLKPLCIRNDLVERRIRMRRKVPIDKADNDLKFCARSSRIKDVDVFAHNLTAVLSSI